MDYVLVRDTIIRKKDIIDISIEHHKYEVNSYLFNTSETKYSANIKIKTDIKEYIFTYKDKENIAQAEIDFMQLFKDLNEK